MVLDKIIRKAQLATKSCGGSQQVEIIDISCDSRTLQKGTLYVAIPGTKAHGDAYISQAVTRGASAIISENPQQGCTIPWAQIENTRCALGLLGKAFWNIDVDSMLLVGITGTNGKTTTAHLYKKLLEQMYGVDETWMLGTINYQLGSALVPASHTTPEALDIFRMIGTAPQAPRALAMEVSSHSLALDRVNGLTYDLAVWTNFTQDHLDFHHTMEEYYAAKKRLFTDHMKKGGKAIVNIDDPWGMRLVKELGSLPCVTYGQSQQAQVRICGHRCDWNGCTIELTEQNHTASFTSALRGFFNVYNMTALVAGARALGLSDEIIDRAFSSITTVPGRMDRVEFDAPFAVIVDYAHTPDALENILRTSRELTSGRLICVFGCGGDRDRTKRPLMAKAVARYSDEAVVTSDNPRSERPMAIIDEILCGIPLDFPHHIDEDRRSAIRRALSIARPGDCVVIAGKGHEDYQEVQGVRHHFNDKEVVKEIYSEMKKGSCNA